MDDMCKEHLTVACLQTASASYTSARMVQKALGTYTKGEGSESEEEEEAFDMVLSMFACMHVLGCSARALM